MRRAEEKRRERRRVLIVDDSAQGADTLRRSLERAGCAVVGEATEGPEALVIASRLQPNLIFLAVGLKGMDGISVAAHVMEKDPRPIILLTRHHDRETVGRAKEAGVMAYLLKPLREEELLPTIELALSRFHEFMALRTEVATLRKALETRKLLERAKGVLMEQVGLSEAEAFRAIQKKSMDSQRSIAEVAEAILLTEEMRKTGRQEQRTPRENDLS